MVRHQWQQQLIQHELHRWQNDERQSQNHHEVLSQNLTLICSTSFPVIVITSSNDIDNELSSGAKSFIEKVHNAYIMHLKVKYYFLI